jgi:hypothetical protein
MRAYRRALLDGGPGSRETGLSTHGTGQSLFDRGHSVRDRRR